MFESKKKKYSEIKEQVITALLEHAKIQPAGKMTSVRILLREVFGDSIEIDQNELFDLAFAFFDRSEQVGLFFDSSHTWRIPTGLPFNCPFLVRPLKPHVEFDAILYTETDLPHPTEKLTINLREKAVYYANGETHGDDLYYLCTSEQWTETTELMESCAFDQWEVRYGNPQPDGMSWKLALIKEGKVQREIAGDNDYPDAWRIFWALKQHCLRLVRREAFFYDKPDICPFCGSANTKRYVFGLPTAEAFDSSKYILGGCESSSSDPKWGCADCGAKFFEGSSFLINEWEERNK